MRARLEVRGLAVRFGGVRAVDAVDLEVGQGQLVGLIGPNGAGKTTLIDALTGFVPATGTVRFAGRDLSGLAPHRRARAGLVRTWQSLELFDDLTVEENLSVAAADRSAVSAALEVVDLAAEADRLPTELSQGQRKLVGVARALAARPALLCLDEPAAGLDSSESLELGERLRAIVATGVSILLVDHDMGLVLSVSDHLYVLEFGRVIAEGPPAEVRVNERVVAAYLGASA
jgi:branched-chain amino acid transport system ATP-binding protein